MKRQVGTSMAVPLSDRWLRSSLVERQQCTGNCTLRRFSWIVKTFTSRTGHRRLSMCALGFCQGTVMESCTVFDVSRRNALASSMEALCSSNLTEGNRQTIERFASVGRLSKMSWLERGSPFCLDVYSGLHFSV